MFLQWSQDRDTRNLSLSPSLSLFGSLSLFLWIYKLSYSLLYVQLDDVPSSHLENGHLQSFPSNKQTFLSSSSSFFAIFCLLHFFSYLLALESLAFLGISKLCLFNCLHFGKFTRQSCDEEDWRRVLAWTSDEILAWRETRKKNHTEIFLQKISWK